MSTHLGPYRLVKKLAVGGMGEVWLAQRAGEVLVVKRLLDHLKDDKDFVTMFFDEARIAAALRHPNIARIIDMGESSGDYFIAMELVRGLSFREVLAKAYEAAGDFPLALKCRVVADAAAALDYAHHAKTPAGAPLELIHRDVSPQNILVGFDGVVKLIDFGVAKAAGKALRTATGVIKGKYAYMSPEQAYGKPLDARSDVFGLGIVLWESLTLERLFRRSTEQATLKAVVGANIPLPSAKAKNVPKGLDAIVMKALTRDRDERYETAAALGDALEHFLKRQRLPATRTHLAARMQELFPTEATELHSSERTPSAPSPVAKDTEPSDKRPAAPAATVLDAAELEVRIAGTSDRDLMHGFFFNALIAAVLRQVGALGEPALRKAARDPKEYVDALEYPTAEFLRVLWRAVELIAPDGTQAEEAFARIGEWTMDALLRAPFGRPLERLRGSTPAEVLKPLVLTIDPAIAPGSRALSDLTPRSARLIFKDEVLPIQFYVGLLRSASLSLAGVNLDAAWEKPSAQRIELSLSWPAT